MSATKKIGKKCHRDKKNRKKKHRDKNLGQKMHQNKNFAKKMSATKNFCIGPPQNRILRGKSVTDMNFSTKPFFGQTLRRGANPLFFTPSCHFFFFQFVLLGTCECFVCDHQRPSRPLDLVNYVITESSTCNPSTGCSCCCHFCDDHLPTHTNSISLLYFAPQSQTPLPTTYSFSPPSLPPFRVTSYFYS